MKRLGYAAVQKRLHNLMSSLSRSQRLVLFAAGFGLIGAVLVFSGFAAGQWESLEPEDGSRSGSVSLVDASGASGGRYVMFGSSAITLSITSPAAGGTVSGTFDMTISYGGNARNIEILNGNTMVARATLNNGTATASINSTTLPNGQVTLLARAWDSLPGTAFTQTADSPSVTYTVQNNTTTPPPPPTQTTPPRQPVVNVKDFGARGDGSTDDTGAINAALNSLTNGGTVEFPAGTYVQAGLININRNGANLWTKEGAELFAITDNSDDQNDAIRIYASDSGVYNLKLTSNARGRGATYEQNRITIFGDNATIKNNHMIGSKAAGIMISGGSGFLIEGNRIEDTLSDSIHSTDGANNGVVRGNIVSNGGDDCIAHVTYGGQPLVNNVLVENNECYNGHARHFSVIGGHSITYRNNLSDGSSVASVMIAAEPSYNTEAPRNVSIINNTFRRGNTGQFTSCCTNHGTIHVWAGRAGYAITDILIAGNTLETQVRGPAQIILDGSDINRVNILNNNLSGSTQPFSINISASSYNLKGNTLNGNPLSDQIGNPGIIPSGY